MLVAYCNCISTRGWGWGKPLSFFVNKFFIDLALPVSDYDPDLIWCDSLVPNNKSVESQLYYSIKYTYFYGSMINNEWTGRLASPGSKSKREQARVDHV